jgi:hypothetical protein
MTDNRVEDPDLRLLVAGTVCEEDGEYFFNRGG